MRFQILAFLLTAPLSGQAVFAKIPSVAVITENLSGDVGDGGIEMVESLAKAGISGSQDASLPSDSFQNATAATAAPSTNAPQRWNPPYRGSTRLNSEIALFLNGDSHIPQAGVDFFHLI